MFKVPSTYKFLLLCGEFKILEGCDKNGLCGEFQKWEIRIIFMLFGKNLWKSNWIFFFSWNVHNKCIVVKSSQSEQKIVLEFCVSKIFNISPRNFFRRKWKMLSIFPYLRKHRFFLIIVQDQWGTNVFKRKLGTAKSYQ